MLLEGDRVTGKNNQPAIGGNHQGTTVDFQLKVDKPVSRGNALNYPHTSLFLESLESDEGEHIIRIREQAGGAGSRTAARELRTLIINVLNDGAPHVALDFEGQAVVSSSFADEVIGKLFADMGFNAFTHRVKLRHMNPTVSTLVDRAIARRLAAN
ncbi:STAS-like domain-containing protein [Nocardioides sp. WL0053]|uniref:STAS-like domain-containing protein n=1 Tax=Nocardioides jiangsuensis TaxID=2866161 RepID=A0ABS7RG03_9ACTN|nr:STAS-like domain-containing protein [Nocardioides jiangsuensis]MBY9073966.1 STAS-like domain-containing protein [Nocardioides jiangsuensis]